MLTIRFARRGKKNAPFFRIIISEKARDTAGRALEILGSYNPISKEKDAQINAERVTYWIGKGAQLSPSVKNLLIAKNIISGTKTPVVSQKKLQRPERKKK